MEQYTKYKEIQDYLETYQDLWHTIEDKTNPSLPLMDVTMDLVDVDHYDYDFSNTRAVCEMFFLGSSDYFPGFHLVDKKTPLDELPIYLFYVDSGDKPELIGNFRKYMTTILKDYIEESNNKKMKIEAKKALQELKSFSKKMIKSKPYKFKKLKS